MRSSLGVDAVGDEVVERAAEVDRRAVGEVAALVEAHAHAPCRPARAAPGTRPCWRWRPSAAARWRARRRTARMARSRARSSASSIDLVAAVVALARVALGVLVGEHRALASSTAGDVKFSDAISWIVVFWRSSSRSMMSAISRIGLGCRAASTSVDRRLLVSRCSADLVDAALVAAALERRCRARAARISSASPAATMRRADRQHVGVVVLARPCARCRGRCRARRGRRAPCWPRSARPGRCRRARCRARRRPRTTARPTAGADRSGSRPAPRCAVPRSSTSWPPLLQHRDEVLLQAEARVVGRRWRSACWRL